jgi:hypothetical protein
MTLNELQHWDIFDGEVRLYEDGRVQHLDGDDWSDGWGSWVAPHPRDADYAAYLEWDAATIAYRVRAGKYSVEVHRARRDGELANGAIGWRADVVFLHDGARLGTGRWDGEGFAECQSLCGSELYLPMEEDDDESEIYRALAAHVRARLARLDPGQASGLALAL